MCLAGATCSEVSAFVKGNSSWRPNPGLHPIQHDPDREMLAGLSVQSGQSSGWPTFWSESVKAARLELRAGGGPTPE